MLAVLLAISAAFSNTDAVLMSINRLRLQNQTKKKHRNPTKFHDFLNRPDRLAALITLGNNVVNILAATLVTIISYQLGSDIAIAPAIAGFIIVVLIFSAVIQKCLSAMPPSILIFLSSFIYIPLIKFFYPVARICHLTANTSAHILGFNNKKGISEVIEQKNNLFDSDHLMPARYQNMLRRIQDLETTKVEDIMTHRNDIIGIDIEEPMANIIEKILSSPHTRLPVYKKNIDRIIGFLHLRKILSELNHPDFDKHRITESLIKPFFIPVGTSIHRQMQTFKAEKLRIGLVADEYGDVLGLVSLDDLLQEIVGELIAEDPDIKIQKDGSFVVDASIPLRELNRLTQWNLPTDGPKTLSGLIIEYMETIPDSGISIKLHGHMLEIVRCDDNTVKLVKFHAYQ